MLTVLKGRHPVLNLVRSSDFGRRERTGSSDVLQAWVSQHEQILLLLLRSHDRFVLDPCSPDDEWQPEGNEENDEGDRPRIDYEILSKEL